MKLSTWVKELSTGVHDLQNKFLTGECGDKLIYMYQGIWIPSSIWSVWCLGFV